MELGRFELRCDGGHLGGADLDATRVGVGVGFGVHGQSGPGGGGTDQVDDDLVLVSGRPRQLLVIAENSLCSILFHLLVPGG